MAAAVGALAWACAGGSSGGGEKGPARNAGAAGSSAPAAVAAAPPTAAPPTGMPPTAMPTVTVTTTVTPSPAADGGPCKPHDLVFTMAAAGSYAAGQDPRFGITVVNTSAASCRFDAGSLGVVVTSGEDRIWSSAECRKGGPGSATLRRGVPYQATVTWDRNRGCGGAAARSGTYVAALKGGKAGKRVFRLR